jgi:hypothetical protein
MQVLLIGLGAGIVSALLFVSLASGSLLSIALFYLAPLPIMLAGLGWSHFAALIAALVAGAGLGLGAGGWFFLAYLGGIGAPAYILTYLAMLGRPAPNGDMEWYPAGRIVLWGALLATAMTLMTIPVFGLDIDTYRAGIKQVFNRVLHLQLGLADSEPLKFPNGHDAQRTLDVLTLIMPPLAASLSMVTLFANLWLAGRVARASGKLARPWPDLSAMAFPSATPLLLLAIMLLSFMHSLVGLTAGVLTACLFMAYAIMGLAVLHAITRANAMRNLILSIVWGLLIVLGWPLALLALLGLADGLFDLRGRSGPPNSNLPNRT